MKIGKYGKQIFSKADEEFAKANYESMTNRELANHFGAGLTATRSFLYAMGLKRMKMEYWNDQMVDYLKANYRSVGDLELSEIFEEKWPKQKPWTLKHIEKKRRYLKLKRTDKELKLIKARNTAAGRFAMCAKKRWETIGTFPIGEIRIWKSSYQTIHSNSEFAVIKTEEGFVHYNRWLYENNFKKLSSDELVVTKSGETIATSPDDLELIDRAENARRNSLLRYPEQLRDTVQLLRELNKQITT